MTSRRKACYRRFGKSRAKLGTLTHSDVEWPNVCGTVVDSGGRNEKRGECETRWKCVKSIRRPGRSAASIRTYVKARAIRSKATEIGLNTVNNVPAAGLEVLGDVSAVESSRNEKIQQVTEKRNNIQKEWHSYRKRRDNRENTLRKKNVAMKAMTLL